MLMRQHVRWRRPRIDTGLHSPDPSGDAADSTLSDLRAAADERKATQPVVCRHERADDGGRSHGRHHLRLQSEGLDTLPHLPSLRPVLLLACTLTVPMHWQLVHTQKQLHV